LYITYLE